jgi:hypothetical protein
MPRMREDGLAVQDNRVPLLPEEVPLCLSREGQEGKDLVQDVQEMRGDEARS